MSKLKRVAKKKDSPTQKTLKNMAEMLRLVTEQWGETKRELALAASKLSELGRRLQTVETDYFRAAHELSEERKQLAAEKTSVEFWTYEASRWRKEAEDLRRAEAIARVERGVA